MFPNMEPVWNDASNEWHLGKVNSDQPTRWSSHIGGDVRDMSPLPKKYKIQVEEFACNLPTYQRDELLNKGKFWYLL